MHMQGFEDENILTLYRNTRDCTLFFAEKTVIFWQKLQPLNPVVTFFFFQTLNFL